MVPPIYVSVLPVVGTGLGTMPPLTSLAGIPQISGSPTEARATTAPTLAGGGDAPGSHDTPARDSVTALMANLLPQATAGLATTSQGVYVGEGLPPVPSKVATKIRRGEFVDMGELLPEFWVPPREEEAQAKSEAKSRRARSVQDIYTWIQCFGTYVSVLAPLHPGRVPELMAYQATIVRASQDYAGLAWVHYDSAFRRQAALTGLTRWSAINPTIYTLCFAGSARTATRCELCFATTHSTKECAQQGDPDPGVRERLRAIEKVVLSLAPEGKRPPPPPRGGGQQRPSGEVCRLFNTNRCTYPLCCHAHVCSSCGEDHMALACPRRPSQTGKSPSPGKPASGGAGRPY